ncbi:hypothetical protein Ancab_009780 [Ancistrocladus abbreviatus]
MSASPLCCPPQSPLNVVSGKRTKYEHPPVYGYYRLNTNATVESSFGIDMGFAPRDSNDMGFLSHVVLFSFWATIIFTHLASASSFSLSSNIRLLFFFPCCDDDRLNFSALKNKRASQTGKKGETRLRCSELYIILCCPVFVELASESFSSIMEPYGASDENERRLYIGNIDHRISEATLIKLFSPYGKIESEDFLWHTRGPKRGEPRGFAFIQYSTKEEARLAKEKMHGRLACGRPLVVRLAGEKCLVETVEQSSKTLGESYKPTSSGNISGQMSRSAKIAAIKNKLKTLEEDSNRSKKQKP